MALAIVSPRLLDRACGGESEAVDGGRVAELLRVPGQHGGDDLGVGRSRGGMVRDRSTLPSDLLNVLGGLRIGFPLGPARLKHTAQSGHMSSHRPQDVQASGTGSTGMPSSRPR